MSRCIKIMASDFICGAPPSPMLSRRRSSNARRGGCWRNMATGMGRPVGKARIGPTTGLGQRGCVFRPLTPLAIRQLAMQWSR